MPTKTRLLPSPACVRISGRRLKGKPAAVSRDGAREQLDAVSHVMRALADPSVDLDRIADMIVKAVMRLADADSSAFMRRDPGGWVRAATRGFSDRRKGVRVDPDMLTLWGRSALSGRRLHVADTKLAEPKLPDAEHRRTRLAVPILRDRESIGVIGVTRDAPGGFDKPTIALVETFADQLAIAMTNARLLKETGDALERQTATAEILKVISQSTSDLQPVFDIVASRALSLCDGDVAWISHLGVAATALRPRLVDRRADGRAEWDEEGEKTTDGELRRWAALAGRTQLADTLRVAIATLSAEQAQWEELSKLAVYGFTSDFTLRAEKEPPSAAPESAPKP